MVTEVATGRPDETAGQALSALGDPARLWDTLTYVFVLDEGSRPLGLVTIERLFNVPPETTLAKIMRRDFIALTPDEDQEEAALSAIREELDAIPVIDAEGRLIGAVDHDDILDILHEEHAEDILRQAGIQAAPGLRPIMEAGARELILRRLPWILVGLAGGMVATEIVGRFERALEAQLALAFFIPVIVYMSDAVATQTETILIRGMSLGRIEPWRYLAREIGVAFALAVASSILLAAFALLRFLSPTVAFIVGFALFVSMFAAVFVAFAIPSILAGLGKDPAYGSGPFATIISDVISILVYFAVAWATLFR